MHVFFREEFLKLGRAYLYTTTNKWNMPNLFQFLLLRRKGQYSRIPSFYLLFSRLVDILVCRVIRHCQCCEEQLGILVGLKNIFTSTMWSHLSMLWICQCVIADNGVYGYTSRCSYSESAGKIPHHNPHSLKLIKFSDLCSAAKMIHYRSMDRELSKTTCQYNASLRTCDGELFKSIWSLWSANWSLTGICKESRMLYIACW